MKIYGLADCNSFFASCEKVFRPEWRSRPVVVLSNNDGCIIARSAEAKPLVAMGTPYFRVREFLARNGVIVRSSNFSLYGDLSHRVMLTLAQWTADIEIYSIDEAFLDLTGRFAGAAKEMSAEDLRQPLARLGEEIVATVPRWTGIPISFGVGPTKTLAKAANHLAKSRPDRYFSLMNPDTRQAALQDFPIEEVWGIGRRLSKNFHRYGLKTAADLIRVDPKWIRENFTIVQEMTLRELRGEECFLLENEPPTPQSIRVSRSFGELISSREEIHRAIALFATRAAQRLRRCRCAASAIIVQLDTNRFRTDLPQSHEARTIGFGEPTSDTITILHHAKLLTDQVYREGFAYQRGMVLLVGIVDQSVERSYRSLFDTEDDIDRRAKRFELMRAIDQVNRAFGTGKIHSAAECAARGNEDGPSWQPSSNFRSPCYTTCWADLPVVKAK